MFTHTQETTDEGYRGLATAVLKQAFDDILLQGPIDFDAAGARPKDAADREGFYRSARAAQRTGALAFLFSPTCHRDRSHWLAWLNMTEQDLWNLLSRPMFRGEANDLLPHCRRGLRSVGVACG